MQVKTLLPRPPPPKYFGTEPPLLAITTSPSVVVTEEFVVDPIYADESLDQTARDVGEERADDRRRMNVAVEDVLGREGGVGAGSAGRRQPREDVSGVGGEVLEPPDEVVVDVAGMAKLVLRAPVRIESATGRVRDVLGELRERHHFACADIICRCRCQYGWLGSRVVSVLD